MDGSTILQVPLSFTVTVNPDFPTVENSLMFGSVEPTWLIRDYTGHRPVTAQSLGDDVDLQPLLERIDREMIPAGKEEQTYRDCIAFARKRELTRRDREITDRLTLADGQIPDEEMNALMREQAEIQRKLKGQGESE